MAQTYWVETLGCPKNQVDSDKLAGTLLADGLTPAVAAQDADLVVVNTCAFIDEARKESIETILDLGESRREGARLVVTGCMAERYGSEVADAIPEADLVAGFGVPVTLNPSKRSARADDEEVPSFDLLNLPRPAANSPWAYVKVAEGCDRRCGFCAIPIFRGPQRSRDVAEVLAEVDALGAKEVVLVAQDLASFGRDQGRGDRLLVSLVDELASRVERVRLLYLYPSDLTDELVDAILRTGVPYFDLSLQHASRPLLARMRRWGDGERFLERIEDIRRVEPEAAFRSNFIVGYPGETEVDHDRLLDFVERAQLDWCGLFPYSAEEGTYAADLDGAVPAELVRERLAELSALSEAITAAKRDELIGTTASVLVDSPGQARSFREAPEIDGVISVPTDLAPGDLVDVRIVGALGPDLVGEPVGGLQAAKAEAVGAAS